MDIGITKNQSWHVSLFKEEEIKNTNFLNVNDIQSNEKNITLQFQNK